MVRNLFLLLILALGACMPAPTPLQLTDNCQAGQTTAELIARDWLQQPAIWRLRQSALLEIGGRKMPMEGFLRLDLQRQEARLLAMNEVGLVLFDIEVNATGETLHRVVPPLLDLDGFSHGVAQSLRQIFLAPHPQLTDHPESRGNSQLLWRSVSDGKLEFVFDCQGDLREARLQSDSDNWQVIYGAYRFFGEFYLPGEIVLNNRQHSLRLSLWTREGRQEL